MCSWIDALYWLLALSPSGVPIIRSYPGSLKYGWVQRMSDCTETITYRV